MTEVYLAGRALASALGPDLPHALRALRAGGVAPAPFEIAPGHVAPFLSIAAADPRRSALADADWAARARRLVRAAAAGCGAIGTRRSALILATTSFDLGAREMHPVFDAHAVGFGEMVAAWLDWQGPVFTVCTACTSAINGLLSARALIRAGEIDDALVIGFELANRFTVGGFHAMQLLSASAALPLGVGRDGLVLGEAVAALRLSATPARWRLGGGANVVDSSDPAGAVADAVTTMSRLALADSSLAPADVDLVKLQAAGSPANDATELAGLRSVFAPLPALVSFKAALGHTLGAAGAAELALLMACIEADLWPAPGYVFDPAIGATLAVQAPPRLRYVLAHILAFGGGHAAVVLEDTATGRSR